jgi:hypothetical protein
MHSTEEVMAKSDLTVRASTAIARPLKILMPLIKEELDHAYEAGVEYYRRVGELLQEAKFEVVRSGGSWQTWLINNFTLTERTAQRYMRLAGHLEFQEAFREVQSNADPARAAGPQRKEIRILSDFTHPGRDPSHRPEWVRPVTEIANRLDVPRLLREHANQAKETAIRRDLALQMIDIGFKVLSSKLHPDKGGSEEAMARLNEIRKTLKQFSEAKWSSK